jgi:hypothetical protein
MPHAFAYSISGTRRVGSRMVYLVRGTPRAGYDPPTAEGRVLTAMRIRLWIDTETLQWTKVVAQVAQPVSLFGFLARVQPGTLFELEEMPVSATVWLPKHFVIRSTSSILFMFRHRTYEEHTYFDYRRVSGS